MGDRLHIESFGQLRAVVDVELNQFELTLMFLGDLFEKWSQFFAGGTPWCIAVEYHGFLTLHYFRLPLIYAINLVHKFFLDLVEELFCAFFSKVFTVVGGEAPHGLLQDSSLH